MRTTFKTVFFFISLISLLIRCNTFSPGTLGSFQKWRFPIPEKQFDSEVNAFFKNNPQYLIPEKWEHLDSWKQNGYGSLNGKIFYFSSHPKEIYYVSYSADVEGFEDKKNPNQRQFLKEQLTWEKKERGPQQKIQKKNEKEIHRIDDRFYKQIITKLEKQANVKSEKYNHWYE